MRPMSNTTKHNAIRRVPELIAGVDLVIYDATFPDQEYPRFRGWGHRPGRKAPSVRDRRGRRLVLFHRHAARSDDALDAIAADVDRLRPGSLVAREGLALRILPGSGLAAARATAPSCHRPTAGRRERDAALAHE